jgi:hypothetical protein
MIFRRQDMLSSRDHRITALERALQLARSGEVGGIPYIRKTLKREGYSEDQLQGSSVKR